MKATESDPVFARAAAPRVGVAFAVGTLSLWLLGVRLGSIGASPAAYFAYFTNWVWALCAVWAYTYALAAALGPGSEAPWWHVPWDTVAGAVLVLFLGAPLMNWLNGAAFLTHNGAADGLASATNWLVHSMWIVAVGLVLLVGRRHVRALRVRMGERVWFAAAAPLLFALTYLIAIDFALDTTYGVPRESVHPAAAALVMLGVAAGGGAAAHVLVGRDEAAP